MAKVPSSEQLGRAGQLVGYASGSRYRVKGDFLFKGIPLTGAHVLEVGCGKGAWSIWAALHGAHRVLGIEPEANGSSPGALATFRRSIESLGLHEQVGAMGISLEELPTTGQPYDVVILYDVINHFDEESVSVLDLDPIAFQKYVILLNKLRMRIRTNGWVIVADCARDNIWNRIGLPAPLAPSIEWHKHQNPETWISVFECAGFQLFDFRWSPLQPFVKLTANWFVQYLTCSHFVLRLQRKEVVIPNRA